jgi:hypothetical protein
MEAADTSAWIANSGAVLSKETTDPHSGLRCLRVKALNGDAAAQARQNAVLVSGKTYRFTGWARIDSVADDAKIYAGSNVVAVTTSTTWTWFDKTLTADNTFAMFGVSYVAADADAYAEFDDVSVQEVSGGAVAPFTVSSGAFSLTQEEVNGQVVDVLQCDTAGVAYIDSNYWGQGTTEAAYGQWDWWLYKDPSSSTKITIVADVIGAHDTVGQDGYLFQALPAEGLVMYLDTNGSLTSKFQSADSTITQSAWNHIKITRSNSGVFSVYAAGSLVAATSGANPFTEATHTLSKYMNFDLDAGDKIALIRRGNTGSFFGDNLLVDGDAEAADTSAWTVGNNATLTKETTDPYAGLRNLRVAYTDTNAPFARQDILTIGTTYRLTGYYRTGGAYGALIDFGSASSRVTLAAAGAWTRVDETMVATSATSLKLFTNVTGAGYAEWDNVSVREVL